MNWSLDFMFLKTLRNIAGSLKWFWLNTLAAIRYNRFKKPPANGKTVYFVLNDNPYDRYLYMLFMLFEINGYHVVIQYRFGFLSRWATSFVVQGNNNVTFSFSARGTFEAYFTNIPAREHRADFLISHDYFNPRSKGHFVPMPMVDSFYIYKFHEASARNAAFSDRNVRIFFAGRFDEDGYSRHELSTYFQCFNRITLFNLIKINFPEHLIVNPPLDELNSLKPEKIVIYDRRASNIEPFQLIEVLRQVNFFLAFPGVVMPLCHNIIESMSLGCIPILQYPHLFHPPLVSGKNCLSFHDEESLKIVVQKALHADHEEINLMRNNVIRYYSQYLSPEGAIENLMSEKGHTKEVFLIAENNSVKLMDSKEP